MTGVTLGHKVDVQRHLTFRCLVLSRVDALACQTQGGGAMRVRRPLVTMHRLYIRSARTVSFVVSGRRHGPGIAAGTTNREQLHDSDRTLVIAVLAAGVYWRSHRQSLRVPSRTARAAERFASVRSSGRRSMPGRAGARRTTLSLISPRHCPLPVAKKRCDCHFAKLSDRRTDDRRWGHDGLSAAMFNTAPRRKLADRRDTTSQLRSG
jgi:hypothetical protein